MGREMQSHKMRGYYEISEFKKDGFCFHRELDTTQVITDNIPSASNFRFVMIYLQGEKKRNSK